MTRSIQDLLEDIAPFSDLGTEPPLFSMDQGTILGRLTRDGMMIDLAIYADGSVVERSNDTERRHVSFRALLASPTFANLGKWADSQRVLLDKIIEKDSLEIFGEVWGTRELGGLDVVDRLLGSARATAPRNTVLLIDGPAGIGKTSIIRKLAHSRARRYREIQHPLVLHVESRGRVLQNIADLMAFSLQSLRLSVTYDQIPALVRKGLVAIAIDGFDELGDPNGYDLAWAQLNDLIISSRGKGQIVLSGRETFISRERILSALSSISEDVDFLESFTLQPIKPNVAKEWLKSRGWTDSALYSESASPLFEDGSYALRPFFLDQLSQPDVATRIEQGLLGDLLSFLINTMLDRESAKFGRDVETVKSRDQRIKFISSLMQEVARDLAENQADSIPSETLSWLSEIVSFEKIPPEITGILKNRAGVIAFLTDDVRRGYKRFIHEPVQNYFLSSVLISSINDGEIPKFVRRNIFGAEFLESFSEVVRHFPVEDMDKFLNVTLSQIKLASSQDRTKRNLCSLVISACSVLPYDGIVEISDLSLDEVYVTETVSPMVFENVTIAQLYARGADLRQMHFKESCIIVSMISDDRTIPSSTIPIPAIVNLPYETITEPEAVENWLRRQYVSFSSENNTWDIEEFLTQFPLFNLLNRVARYKPYWMKDGDERSARRIIDDPSWETLKAFLHKHDLLIERNIPASGRPSIFYHVKNRNALMSLETPPEELIPFLQDLLGQSLRRL